MPVATTSSEGYFTYEPSSPTSSSSSCPSSPSSSYRRPKTSPPLDVCVQINADIRANPTLNSPYFDLGGHIMNREYCMQNIIYPDETHETATLLDVGVRDLLPAPVPPPVPPPKSRTFEIKETPQKHGLGMFAAQNIPAGGLVAVEHPTVILPYVLGVEPDCEAELYAELLGRLSASTAERFLSLANCKPGSSLKGIMNTNAVAIALDVPDVPHAELSTHRAVFLNMSRCNHSCSPNAAWHYDSPSFSLSLEALRPIEAGEEITVAYITTTCSAAERSARLEAMYNFTCSCTICSLPPLALAQSDAARAELAVFWRHSNRIPSFEAWCRDPRMGDTVLIDAHKRALDLIEHEGLQVLDYGKHLDAIAMGYGALRNVYLFRAWMWRAREARPLGRLDAARVMQKWIREPETFPVWGWRRFSRGPRSS
ncbi:hypothetical protein FB45DRAFT_1008361 [Roridomyces roridus]|uniref:SET domain-containing protein n=1 Tax=Roridomyces roridus TaxID=1738132 RepID=A0AAD7BAT9_9AGAR|nr:hypothetical protein FB45DRAFT_1008361 [Roridomyces roridus]